MTNSNNDWDLDEEAIELLGCLAAAIHSLKSLAITGNDLIGLGEVIAAIESLLNEDKIDINVSLDIGFRRGDSDFEEGLFVCLRINSEEIILNELNTTHSSDIGSDSYTVDYVHLVPGSHLNHMVNSTTKCNFDKCLVAKDVLVSKASRPASQSSHDLSTP